MAEMGDSIAIRGFFGQDDWGVSISRSNSNDPSSSYEKRYVTYGGDGKEIGPILMRMEGDHSRSAIDTPWGSLNITYSKKRPMNFEIVKDRKHIADAMHTIRKPIILDFLDGRRVAFKGKRSKMRLVSKNAFGTYEIEYGQLSGESLWTSLPKGDGYRRWRISVLGDSSIDKKVFFSTLGAFTCHLYEMLWPDYPNTIQSMSCFPVGD
jgi:hypothetical protein